MSELNRFEIAAIKRTAQNTKPLYNKAKKLQADIDKKTAELNEIKEAIMAWEAPIVKMTNGRTSQEVVAANFVIETENPTPVAEDTEHDVPQTGCCFGKDIPPYSGPDFVVPPTPTNGEVDDLI